uniref:Jellein-3 n=1 Tax=Apis mellifera TaxID=7460 RepID=JELL3_APIME|nr:RecName: Full=Jellein-3; AltName: Full=Jelleine-III [Apis mellifera]
EPFKISIHL